MVVMSVKLVQHKEACKTLKATKIMDFYNKPGIHKPNSNSQHSCASQTPPVNMRVGEDVEDARPTWRWQMMVHKQMKLIVDLKVMQV